MSTRTRQHITSVAVSDDEDELAQMSVRACRTQTSTADVVGAAVPVTDVGDRGRRRARAICWPSSSSPPANASSMCPRRWRHARVCLARVGRTRTTRTTPESVALTALRHHDLREVRPVGHSEVLRLLAKRNNDIGDQRTRLVGRMHALLVELAPGGIAKEINASDVDAFLAELAPASPIEQIRFDLAVELLDDIRRLDAQLKVSHKRIRTAVTASSTSLTDVFGIGPIIAAMLIGYTGDIARFRTRDHYAAYNGTAPVEFSSGGRTVHRLSTRGNRN